MSLIPITGQSPLAESPEAAKKLQDQNMDIADKQANQERLKGDFDNNTEVQALKSTLDSVIDWKTQEKLIDPETKENILWRLLLKYEKSQDDFNFNDSLHKVFYWEDIGGMRSTGIAIEDKDIVFNALTGRDKDLLTTKKVDINWEDETENPQNTLEGEEVQKDENAEAELEASLNDVDIDEETITKSESNNESKALTEKNTDVSNEKTGTGLSIQFNSFTPIIEQYGKIWMINTEQVNLIKENISSWLWLPEMLEVWIDSDIKESLKSTLISIESDEKIEENKADFLEDFQNISNQTIDLEEDRVFAAIWEKYTRIWDASNESKNANFSIAAKLARSQILKNTPTIKQDTEWFKTAIANIDSGDHKKEYLWIKYLQQEWTQEAWKWKKLDVASREKGKVTQVANNNAADAFKESQNSKLRADAEATLVANNQALAESSLSTPEEKGWDVFGTVWDLEKATASI